MRMYTVCMREDLQKGSATRTDILRIARELEMELEHMKSTRSWRYTQWVRTAEAFVRRVFQRKRQTQMQLQAPARKRAGAAGSRLQTVSVVIPCHNYGHFLAQALESVLAQTVQPNDILVVDDASDDDTLLVAKSFAERGVRCIHGEWRSVGAARNAGLDATRSEFIVFLDADDVLHPNYIEQCLAAVQEQSDVALVYGNMQLFGDQDFLFDPPAVFDRALFEAENFIHASSLVRRTALVEAGKCSHGVQQDGDWVTWRRILQHGWKAVKGEGYLFYRFHAASMTHALESTQSYAKRAGFFEEPLQLFLSLSGRRWAWPKTAAFLHNQTFPHHLVKLVILDTSQDASFGTMVQEWLRQSDYPDPVYRAQAVGPAGIADKPRDALTGRDVADICADIYNRFAREVTTSLVCFLEDDIVPPNDAYVRLVSALTPTTLSVSGFYRHRNGERKPVAWQWDEATHDPVFAKPSAGVTQVGGNGFGCVVVRGAVVRDTHFSAGPPHDNYDHNFYRQHTDAGWQAFLDWGCICDHLSSPQ